MCYYNKKLFKIIIYTKYTNTQENEYIYILRNSKYGA